MTAAADLMSEILTIVIKNSAGQDGKEIAWEIEGLAREGGADGLAFPSIVASALTALYRTRCRPIVGSGQKNPSPLMWRKD